MSTTVTQSQEATAPTVEGADEPVARVRSLVRHFRRRNGDVVKAIDGVDLDVAPGEFLVLLGPSGCGKTTLLRTIAGLETPDSGRIEIRGRAVFDKQRRIALPPEQRDLGMIFQSYALWPHMTVFKNIAYPLQRRGSKLSRAQIKQRVENVSALLGLEALVDQHPGQLSGGQQQRVALARALVGSKDFVLFDEPLSNVDAKVREQLRREIKSMQTELGFSAIYVTHDQTEAMELADRIAVVQEGAVAQVGSPRAIYDAPVSRYVANFVGSSNQIEGRIVEAVGSDEWIVETSFGRVHAAQSVDGLSVGDDVVLIIRPERVQLSSTEPDTTNRWHGSVDAGMYLGAHVELVVRVGSERFLVWDANHAPLPRGAEGWLSVAPEWVRVLPFAKAL